jgi:cob(I)alamin adenosyltransferase
MADETDRFEAPRLAINRVYTKKGDQGGTSLVGGQKVEKDDLRIESYGTVDELNAVVGAARVSALEATQRSSDDATRARLERLSASLLRAQHELFNLGSLLATLPEDLHPKQARVTDEDVAALEEEMDEANEILAPLRSFVLPGGSRLNTDLHLARTVCRRAERAVVRLLHTTSVDLVAVRYLNRLSDALFVWSRLAAKLEGDVEVLWAPNASASGSKT